MKRFIVIALLSTGCWGKLLEDPTPPTVCGIDAGVEVADSGHEGASDASDGRYCLQPYDYCANICINYDGNTYTSVHQCIEDLCCASWP